jgi:hypothetical protein
MSLTSTSPYSFTAWCLVNSFTLINSSLFLTFIQRDNMLASLKEVKGTAVPLQALEWPRRYQEVKVPRFHVNGTGWW